MPQIELIGYLLSVWGIGPTEFKEFKVEAVVNAREPEVCCRNERFYGSPEFQCEISTYPRRFT